VKGTVRVGQSPSRGFFFDWLMLVIFELTRRSRAEFDERRRKRREGRRRAAATVPSAARDSRP
jgi:hypothetical protein